MNQSTSYKTKIFDIKIIALAIVSFLLFLQLGSSTIALGASASGMSARAGSLSQNGQQVDGLDDTWMYSSSLQNDELWHTASGDEKFIESQTVKFASKNEWADAKLYQNGDEKLDGQFYVVYNENLYRHDYGNSYKPDAVTETWQGWTFVSSTKPTAQYTFTFEKKSDSGILADLQKERERIASFKHVFAYMPSWGIYDGHEYFDVNTINYDQITHVTYSFLQPVGVDSASPDIAWDDSWAALGERGPGEINDGSLAGIVQKLRAATQDKKDKFFVFSVGGWTYSEQNEFERATSTPQKIDAFAQNIVNFMERWDFDGVDIDWEFPKDAQGAQQFLDLHRVIREKLTTLSLKTEKYYQLSTATTPNINGIQWIRPAELVDYVDTVNFMAYDYYGGSFGLNTPALHNAPLYTSIAGYGAAENKDFNIDAVAKEYVRQGVPESQLLIGTAFYSRSWIGVEAGNDPNHPGLGGFGTELPPVDISAVGQWGQGSNPYYRMEDLLDKSVSVPGNNNDYERYWDDGAKAPYLYSKSQKVYHSYDDSESIGIKVSYIEDGGYAGAIVWDITGDTRADKGTSGAYTLGAIVGRLVGQENDGSSVNDVTKITTTALSDAREYDNYSGQINAKGQSVTFSLSSNPSWLSIDSATGRLSGIPTSDQVGKDQTFTVDAKSTLTGNDSKSYTISVLPQNQVVIQTKSLPDGIVEKDYSMMSGANIVADGTGLSYSLLEKPSWMSIDSSGKLSGVPDAVQNGVTIKVEVSKGQIKVEQAYTINILDKDAIIPVKITTTRIDDGKVGEYYSALISATGVNVRFEVSQNPSWLSINSSTGSLNGTPDVPGSLTIVVTASDDSGQSDQVTLTFSIAPADNGGGGNGGGGGNSLVRIMNTELPNAKAGVDYASIEGSRIIVEGGGTITFGIGGGPVWLTIDANGQLMGTPSSDSVDTSLLITITVTSSSGQQDIKQFDLGVSPGKNDGGNGWILIAAIVGAVIVLGAVGFFIFKKMKSGGSSSSGGNSGYRQMTNRTGPTRGSTINRGGTTGRSGPSSRGGTGRR